MPKGSSTVYEVSHIIRGITIERMRINDNSMMRAKNGETNYEKNVAMAFRSRVIKDHKFDPGWIEFKKLKFTPLRALDAVP